MCSHNEILKSGESAGADSTMLQLYHSSNADRIDSVISYSGGTMAAFVNWSSGKPGSALVNTKMKGPGPHLFDSKFIS